MKLEEQHGPPLGCLSLGCLGASGRGGGGRATSFGSHPFWSKTCLTFRSPEARTKWLFCNPGSRRGCASSPEGASAPHPLCRKNDPDGTRRALGSQSTVQKKGAGPAETDPWDCLEKARLRGPCQARASPLSRARSWRVHPAPQGSSQRLGVFPYPLQAKQSQPTPELLACQAL